MTELYEYIQTWGVMLTLITYFSAGVGIYAGWKCWSGAWAIINRGIKAGVETLIP